MEFFENILLEIKKESQKKGLSLNVLAKQTRLRSDYLSDLFDKNSDQNLTLSQIRQIKKLAEFLKVEFDKKNWNKEYNLAAAATNNLGLTKKKNTIFTKINSVKIFYIFTITNFNTFLLTIITITVITLVGLPIFLVVRPAEVLWYSQNVSGNIITLTKPLENIKGTTKRAKSMIFGGQTILLKNGDFSLDLPKPDRSAVIQITLTNYFNLTTDYNIIIKPST